MEDYRTLQTNDGAQTPYRFSALRLIGSLGLIVLMIVGTVYLMRLMMAKGMRYDLKGHHIKVLDVVQLGLNRSLYLVSVGKKAILIGASDKGMSHISDVGGVDGIKEAHGEFSEDGGVGFKDSLTESLRNTVSGPAAGLGIFGEKLKEKLKKLEEEGSSDGEDKT